MTRLRPALLALCTAGLVLAQEPLLADGFEAALAPTRWEAVRVHDTRSDRIEATQGRLLLGLDTLGTDDATVKLRGVRSREAFALDEAQGLALEAALDWNAQPNGCYLTLGLALVPEAASDPRSAAEALAYELVGVPPGKNVRPALWRRASCALRPLWSDGWPQPRREDRVGRPARPLKVRLEVAGKTVRLLEDGQERWSGPGAEGFAGRVRVLVFVTGHSNYPLREVRVDDLKLERIGA